MIQTSAWKRGFRAVDFMLVLNKTQCLEETYNDLNTSTSQIIDNNAELLALFNLVKVGILHHVTTFCVN